MARSDRPWTHTRSCRSSTDAQFVCLCSSACADQPLEAVALQWYIVGLCEHSECLGGTRSLSVLGGLVLSTRTASCGAEGRPKDYGAHADTSVGTATGGRCLQAVNGGSRIPLRLVVHSILRSLRSALWDIIRAASRKANPIASQESAREVRRYVTAQVRYSAHTAAQRSGCTASLTAGAPFGGGTALVPPGSATASAGPAGRP